jgi:GDP-L-fucose synthase
MTERPKVLLLGGRGLVGRAIRTQAFKSHDYIWRFPSHDQLNCLVEQDVLNYLVEYKPDFVIHAAGKVGGIKANMENQYEFLTKNAQMGLSVVNAVHSYNQIMNTPLRLLNLASTCMYSLATPQPFQPHSILGGRLEPTNEGYALAKILVTKAIQYLAVKSPDYYKTIIPCNLYGPWDKFDEDNAHLVPAIIAKIHEAKKSGNKVVEVWGSGEVRREFMYVEDLADFIFFALEQWTSIPSLMNVGVGEDHSIQEYYEVVAEVVGCSDLAFVYDNTKPTGVRSKLCDVTQQRMLGWMPKTSLKDGIAKTYSAYSSKLEGSW